MTISSITFNDGSGGRTVIHFENGTVLDSKNNKITDTGLKDLIQNSTSTLVSWSTTTQMNQTSTLNDSHKNKLEQALISFQQNPTTKTGPSTYLLSFAISDNTAEEIAIIKCMFYEAHTDASLTSRDKEALILQTIQLLGKISTNSVDQTVLNDIAYAIKYMKKAIDGISHIPSAEFIKATTNAIKTFTNLINAAKAAGINVDDAKDALKDSLTGLATKIQGMHPSEAAKATKDLAEAMNAAKAAKAVKIGTGRAIVQTIETIATKIQGMHPSEAAKAAKDLAEAINAAQDTKIRDKAKDALTDALKGIATKINSMHPSEAAKAAKDLADAIGIAKDAGINVHKAKDTLAKSLSKIAPKVIGMPAGKESEAVTNLGNAIKTAGLEPEDIGNAGIMCKLVADGTLKPTGNGEFTVGSESGFHDGTNGRIWLESGKFQMEITGELTEELINGLAAFKGKINNAGFDPSEPIKIDPKALEASDVQKALKKNAFIFYDFTSKPPIMFTQRRNHFGKLESSALSYDGEAWREIKKPKSDSTAPDFTGTSQQHSDSSQLKINTNNITSANSNNSEEQLKALLELLKDYREQAQQSAAQKQQAKQAHN